MQVKQLRRSLGRLFQEHQEALHTSQPIGFLRRWMRRILRGLGGRNNRKYIVDGLAKALYVRTRATIAICIRASIYHSFRIFQRCGHLLSSKIYQVELLTISCLNRYFNSYARPRGVRLVKRRDSVVLRHLYLHLHLHLLILLQEGSLARYRRRPSIPMDIAFRQAFHQAFQQAFSH